MVRVDVDQHEVMEAVVTHLRTALTLNDRTCYEVLSANDPPIHWMGTDDNWCLLISPGAGQFDAGLFHGGGAEQTMEAWQLAIGIYTRIELDESGHDKEALSQANRGILRLKKLVLNALSDIDLATDGTHGQDPETSEVFLRETLRPVSATAPRYLVPVDDDGTPGMGLVQMILSFSCPFDWDLD